MVDDPGNASFRDRVGQLEEHITIRCVQSAEAIYAYDFEGVRYDVGEKLGFIQTTIEFALQREDLRRRLLDYLSEVMEKEISGKI